MKILSAVLFILYSSQVFAQEVSYQTLSFFDDELRASLSIDPKDRSGDEYVMKIKWVNSSNQLVDPGGVEVDLWMPEGRHYSAPTEVTRVGEGLFTVTSMYFIMGGEWEIRVKVKRGFWQEEVQKWLVSFDRGFVCTSENSTSP